MGFRRHSIRTEATCAGLWPAVSTSSGPDMHIAPHQGPFTQGPLWRLACRVLSKEAPSSSRAPSASGPGTMKPLLHMLRQTRSSSEPWQPRHSPQPAPAGIFTADELWGRCEPPQPTCTPACWLLHRHEAARERQHRVAHFDGGTSVRQAVHAVVREADGWSSGHRSQLKAVLVAGNLRRVQVYSRPLPRMLS